MAKEPKCPYKIPDEECCEEKDCPVYKQRLKQSKKKK